jgi:hypothetical protein
MLLGSEEPERLHLAHLILDDREAVLVDTEGEHPRRSRAAAGAAR